MRAVVQRVLEGSVSVDGDITGSIEHGFVVLLGVENGDSEKDVEYMAEKICGLRVFEDEDGKMNLSLKDTKGSMLVISQFTLLGDARKGKRPSFAAAAVPDTAYPLYKKFIDEVQKRNIFTQEGVFGAEMKVALINDGPVTIMLDSKKLF